MKAKRRFKFGRFFFTLLFIGCVGMLCSNFYSQEIKLREIRKEKQELTEKRDELLIEKTRMDRLVEYSQTDEYLEQYVRDTLRWTKKGEKIILPDAPKQSGDDQAQNENNLENAKAAEQEGGEEDGADAAEDSGAASGENTARAQKSSEEG